MHVENDLALNDLAEDDWTEAASTESGAEDDWTGAALTESGAIIENGSMKAAGIVSTEPGAIIKNALIEADTLVEIDVEAQSV